MARTRFNLHDSSTQDDTQRKLLVRGELERAHHDGGVYGKVEVEKGGHC